ncbi:hypothetical protein EDD16DRAFT_245589 [Pisolithus croceorrhizus]|nr:hypothetical protein EV401DRAFT_2079222 [Pisolithus croceorrhizus]KAI6104826.1 hypothetical protein EDD16DRAFT_245589 [Pisolithus croceorrhizus]
MASNLDEGRSGTLEHSMEVDSFTEADNISALSTDDYIQVQVGGGCREPTPVIVTPTHLQQKIKATGRDTGLVRDASFRRSQLPKQVTLLPATKETCTDDDPFLSQPDGQLFCDTTSPVTNGSPEPSEETPQQRLVKVSALRASTEDPVVERLDSLSRGAGNRSSVPLLRRDTKPGLAPSALLDKLGFEPAGHAVIMPPPVTKAIPSIKIVPPMLKPPSCPDSPSLSGIPSSSLAISQDFFNIEETEISNDKGDQASVVGRVSDSVLAVLTEGFDEIDEMFSKLAARVKMPFHQVSDHYICLHSRTHGTNLWNMYSMYFAKNMERELARLPKGEQITGTPTADIQKRCFTLFKAEYKDMYSTILETWKEVSDSYFLSNTKLLY